MTDLEISKALALVIGYPLHHIRRYGVGSINFNIGAGIVQVFRPDEVYGPDRTEFSYLWRTFDYRDWSVIGPIAARYDAFPQRVRMGELSDWTAAAYGSKWADADTPQKAIALAVIEGAKK